MNPELLQALNLMLNVLIIPMLYLLVGIRSELAELRRWLTGHEKDIAEIRGDLRQMRTP